MLGLFDERVSNGWGADFVDLVTNVCVTFDGHVCARLVGLQYNKFSAVTNLMQYSTSSRH